MKNLLFFFALLALMVMTVPRADAAGPPDRQNEIVLCVDHAVTVISIAPVACLPFVIYRQNDWPPLRVPEFGDCIVFATYVMAPADIPHPPDIMKLKVNVSKILPNSHSTFLPVLHPS